MRSQTVYLAITLSLASSFASAVPWTYRGSVNDGGQPANESCNIRVSLLSGSHNASITTPSTFTRVVADKAQFAVSVVLGFDGGNAPAMRLPTDSYRFRGEQGSGPGKWRH